MRTNAPQQFQWVNGQSCKRLPTAQQLDISACCPGYYLHNDNPGDETGFMWSDFQVNKEDSTIFDYDRIGFAFGCKTTQQLLELTNKEGTKKLRGILRAHQHTAALNPMMQLLLDYKKQDPANKGIAKLWTDDIKKGNRLWDGIVVTFNVSPDTPYGIAGTSPGWPGFNFDTIGTLTINGSFEHWTLDIARKAI